MISVDKELAKAVDQKVSLKEGGKNAPYERWTLLDEDTIEYGYLSKTGGVVSSTTDDNTNSADAPPPTPFYLTTAINYTNGPAHMGHAYEAVTSDVIVRHHRNDGSRKSSSSKNKQRPVYFVTGADEHGQKIAETAAAQDKVPLDICNQYVTGFTVLNQRLGISNDDYVRTTSERHKRTARALWNKCAAAGDVYLDTYQGWYNVREETFVTETEAALVEYKDPVTGIPFKQVEEESYFFRMSKYKDRLIQHITVDNPDFIRPVNHKNLIVQRLQSDDLRDLSISRTTFDWGITVPDSFADNHVMYVWLDALSNYLTGVNGLDVDPDAPAHLSSFWPASVHVIGKDILWFHTVIWPCLLMSAGVPLPNCVFAHGFVNDKEGKKMSKSIGNVVDPHDMLDQFDVDTFRWYLCKEAPYGGELSFSEDSMRDMHNSDLCGTLGNLVHRATSLCSKYCDGVVPDVSPPATPPVGNLAELVASYTSKMNAFELQGGANLAIQGMRDINGFLQDQAPWHIKDDLTAQQVIVRATLEAVYATAHLLLPFLPTGGAKIFAKLGTEPVSLGDLNLTECRNLTVGTKIEVGDILYERSVSADEAATVPGSSSKKKESHAEAQARKKEAKAKAIAASQAGQGATQAEFTKMDVRVGHIVKVWNHDTADKLFCEAIDIGEEEPREIASGLRGHYTLEEMEGRKVLVVCNLKAAKIVGFTSNGMVLAAKCPDGEKVELIEAPDDATVGERVAIEGLSGEAVSSTQVKKKKIWESVAKDLKTGEGGVATWQGKEIRTLAGVCKAASLSGVPIS